MHLQFEINQVYCLERKLKNDCEWEYCWYVIHILVYSLCIYILYVKFLCKKHKLNYKHKEYKGDCWFDCCYYGIQ